MARIFTICIILIMPMVSRTALADIFQYTDAHGTVVMVDDESKIPKKFRNQTRITRSDSAGERKITSVIVRNNHVLVPVRFSYHDTTVEALLLLDTGATTTVISTKLANRLGITPAHTQSHSGWVADGREVQTFRVRIDYMAVGPKVKLNPEVSIMPSNGPEVEYDGLLGMNFLSENTYRLDTKTQIMEWQQ